MKKLKKYENFFGGTHLGPDQVNTDSAHVRNINQQPDEFSTEIISNISDLKGEIIDLLDKEDFDVIQLEKIKNFITNL